MQITSKGFQANTVKNNFNLVPQNGKGTKKSEGTVAVNKREKEDTASDNLKAQINALRERMQRIMESDKLDAKTKTELRQSLQEQMNGLSKQLVQSQADFLKQQQEEEKENDPQNTEEAQTSGKRFDRYEGAPSGSSSGLSARTANAIIAADTAMDQARVHSGVAAVKKDAVERFKKEIRKDIREVDITEARGVPDPVNPDKAPAGLLITERTEIQRGPVVEAKEKAIAELEMGIASAKRSQVRTLASAVNIIRDAEESEEEELDTGSEEAEEAILNSVEGNMYSSSGVSSSVSVHLTFDEFV